MTRRRNGGSQQRSTVDEQIELRLVVPDADAVTLPVTFHYGIDDPYAVRAQFHGEGSDVEWVFARDLLAAGLDGMSGEGDVKVWPAPAMRPGIVLISLSSPDGRAVLEADSHDVRAFLDLSEQIVPMGAESDHLDLDAGLAGLVA